VHLVRVIAHIFRRLQWKLTLTYTLVTAAAIILMQILFLGYYAYFSDSFAPLLVFSMQDEAEQLRPYLQATPPDRAGLEDWLQDAQKDDVLHVSDEGVPVGEIVMMAVVDNTGRVLASEPAHAVPVGEQLAAHLDEPSTEIVQIALENPSAPDIERQERLELLSGRSADNALVAAVPILDTDDQVLGAWLAMTDQTTSGSMQAMAAFMLELIPSVAQVAVIFAIVVGAVFGFITARGLTRRLRNLVQAASAWSEGDFTATAQDRSGDELGQLAQQLNRMAEELRNLLHVRQELATVDERNRLARELHDSVKQQLFATAMQVGAARALLERNDPAADERLADAERLAHAAQQELTMIIHELRPAALESKGLAAALRDYVDDWSRHSGIAAHVSYQGQRELPLLLEQTLFRVAQEALANVARHSGASRVQVQVQWDPQTVTLTVADNGRGFSMDARPKTGVGLKSMQERLESLGGTFTLASAPEQGTTVTAQLATDGHSLHVGIANNQTNGATDKLEEQEHA
jgi:NarL family two-component system sensor histidine kinase LiaS